MKICIVTVYDNLNSGSYWQAFALGEIIKMQGHEVLYFKQKKNGSSLSLVFQLKKIANLLFHLHFLETYDYLRLILSFKTAQKKFKIINKTNKIYNHIDCFILGSDTIWNINKEYYKKNKAIFWGDIFKGRKVISYAGSIANTKPECILNNKDYSNSIKYWNAISVRDEYTKKNLSEITDKTIHTVCDPTLLLPKVFYMGFCKHQKRMYIFLYLYRNLSIQHEIELNTFAKKNNLKIICGTQRNIFPSADVFIVNSPKNFIEYLLGSKYIVTDTYHGTAFSINFNKQFVAINRGKNKVNFILSYFGLTNRTANNSTNLIDILNTTINYSIINETLNKTRRDSLSFLENNLV